MNEYDDLPRSEFAFPGPLRDRLVCAILDGSKTSTTSTAVEYEIKNESLPQIGARQVVVDSASKAVAVIETTAVHHVRLADVPWGMRATRVRNMCRLPNGELDTSGSGTARRCGISFETRRSL